MNTTDMNAIMLGSRRSWKPGWTFSASVTRSRPVLSVPPWALRRLQLCDHQRSADGNIGRKDWNASTHDVRIPLLMVYITIVCVMVRVLWIMVRAWHWPKRNIYAGYVGLGNAEHSATVIAKSTTSWVENTGINIDLYDDDQRDSTKIHIRLYCETSYTPAMW